MHSEKRFFPGSTSVTILVASMSRWSGTETLDVSYGACDTGQWHTPAEDRITIKQAVWRGIVINYFDTHHTAVR